MQYSFDCVQLIGISYYYLFTILICAVCSRTCRQSYKRRSQILVRYLVVGLVGLVLVYRVSRVGRVSRVSRVNRVSRVRVTAFGVSRVSAMVSVRFSGIWDRRL